MKNETLDNRENELVDLLIPLLVVSQDIEKHTRRKPTALMLPLSLAPLADTVWGLPVIPGDRAALVYGSP